MSRIGVALAVCSICLACGAPPPSPARPHAAAAPPERTTAGWHLTVYYTPVEPFHGPPRQSISDCSGRPLGQHSADFMARVQVEGFGRVFAPVQGVGYLGWDFDRRCWFMAGAPLGATDRPLRAWVSTAAQAAIPTGTHVRVMSCGANVEAETCARVERAAWTVDDRCSGGCGDPQHLDLYIGEEDQADFEGRSPSYFETREGVVTLTG